MTAVYSMTGFATATADGFSVTMKSVNHRFLDLQVRVPPGWDDIEQVLAGAVRGAVRRGHVEVSLQVVGGEGGSTALRRNDALLAELIKAYRDAATLHGLRGEPELNALLRSPGVLVSETSRAMPTIDEVSEALSSLVERFTAVRATEGACLAAAMRASMDRLLVFADDLAVLRVGVRDAHFARLRDRLMEVMAGKDPAEGRIITEAALLAQRSDVEEEIVRLRTHALQFRAMLDAGGEVGKRLDFLLQEMNREANTMLSKVNGGMGESGLRLTDIGLGIKAEIEQVKEQVQNVE